jgi:hypothetical protein
MLTALLAVWAILAPAKVQAANPDTAARCAQVRNDDTVRPYDPSLRAGLIRAYAGLFPDASPPPPEAQLKLGAHIRCMNGRLFACFTGANLPCGKMNTARDNQGADDYCRANADADVVPAFATGHDTIYSYRCASGRPVIVGPPLTLDARGFAARLWAPLN